MISNYVLQHLLGLKESDITDVIVRQLQESFVPISCYKYGSNVVEKCLIESSGEQCTRIITEFVRSPNASMMLLDPFGNFVIQSALSVTKVSSSAPVTVNFSDCAVDVMSSYRNTVPCSL